MMIGTAFACNNNNAPVVGHLRYGLHVPALAHLARIDELHFGLQLRQGYALAGHPMALILLQ